MKHITTLCAILLVTVFAAGCSEQKAPTAILDGQPEVSSKLYKGPPSSSGTRVVRFTLPAGFAIAFFDPQQQLVALLAVDDGLLGCTTVTDFIEVDIQQVFSPTGAVRQLVVAKDAFVFIYDATGLPPFPPLTCSFLTGSRLLAEGRAVVVNTDNDAPVAGPGANAFGTRSNGQIDLVGGGKVLFHLKQQFLIKPDGSFVVLANDIVLNPDPR